MSFLKKNCVAFLDRPLLLDIYYFFEYGPVYVYETLLFDFHLWGQFLTSHCFLFHARKTTKRLFRKIMHKISHISHISITHFVFFLIITSRKNSHCQNNDKREQRLYAQLTAQNWRTMLRSHKRIKQLPANCVVSVHSWDALVWLLLSTISVAVVTSYRIYWIGLQLSVMLDIFAVLSYKSVSFKVYAPLGVARSGFFVLRILIKTAGFQLICSVWKAWM